LEADLDLLAGSVLAEINLADNTATRTLQHQQQQQQQQQQQKQLCYS
jgi:transcription initiation factor TFIID subunit TAF12